MLRRATAEEAERLADILRRAMRESVPGLPDIHTPEDNRRFVRDVVLPNEEVWVAEQGGQVVGFRGPRRTRREGPPSAPLRRKGPPASRRRHRAHRPGKETDRVRLWVFQRNQGTRRFYERHGLRLVELTDGAGNEEAEPDACYEWVPWSS